MNLFKFISKLFGKKKKPVIDDPTESIYHTEIKSKEKKDYTENLGIMIPEKALTQEEVEGVRKIFEPDPPKKSLRELAKKNPYRPKGKQIQKVIAATELVDVKVCDATPNPLKYWRRFKRGNKFYWKKFYQTEGA